MKMGSMVLTFLLVVGAALVPRWRAVRQRGEKQMKQNLYFYFVDFSPFHGDGNVIWVSEAGLAVVQKASADKSRVFKFDLPKEDLVRLKSFLRSVEDEPLSVKSRNRIPDEVVIRFGFHRSSGDWIALEVVENDWSQQTKSVQTFNDFAQRILNLTNNSSPVRTDDFKPGKLQLDRPSEFSADDIKQAFAHNTGVKRAF
jgi:hypothetical protein